MSTPDNEEPELTEVKCIGHGRAKCLQEGKHNWFNHAMDGYHKYPWLPNVPANYDDEGNTVLPPIVDGAYDA